MKRKILLIAFFSLLTIFSFFYKSKDKTLTQPDLLVTIAPYKYFIEKLTDNSVNVAYLVPVDGDPHGFSPSAKEFASMYQAKAWFTIGEPFEGHFLPILQKQNPNIKVIALNENLDTLHIHCGHHHHHCQEDLHFWTSPKMMQLQVEKIATTLKEIYPEKSDLIDQKLADLQLQFKALNQLFIDQIATTDQHYLLVSHPAFGYFCHDYHLKQLSIEDESQDSSPKQLTEILESAKKHQIKKIYVQKQYNYKTAELAASKLKLEMVEVNPYAENYFENMNEFATHLGE